MTVVHMSLVPWSTDPSDGCEPVVKTQGTAADLRRIWDAGIPFFTKDAMRDVQAQLQTARRGDRIRIRSLLGTDIYFRVCTGDEVNPGWKCDRRFMGPQIFWRDYFHLQADVKKRAIVPFSSMIIAAETGRFTDAGTPLSPANICSVAAARGILARGVRAFADSEPENRLDAALRSRLPRVKKIVALANNSFAVAQTGRPRDDSSEVQHALMLALRKMLLDIEGEHGTSHAGKENGGPTKSVREIALFAQDPVYTDVDRVVLAEHGIEVVDDPGGFLEVDGEAAVLSFAPNVPVRSIVADIELPAMMIWNTVEPRVEKAFPSTCPDTARTNAMVNLYYDRFAFSRVSDHQAGAGASSDCESRKWFGNSSIYIRKPDIQSPRVDDALIPDRFMGR